MPDIIKLKRNYPNEPFGFKLQGGQDFSIPLSILDVTQHSLAHQVGLRPGDAIIKVNNSETGWMDHNRAKQEIMNTGDEIWLTIVRNAVNTFKPQVTPLSALKMNVPHNSGRYPVAAPIQTSLAADKQPSILVGSSHNRAPMPFNKNIGTSVVYQAAKPSNWQAGDYTRLNDPSYNNNVTQNNNHQYQAPPHQPHQPQQHREQFVQQFNPTHSQYSPNQYEYACQYAPDPYSPKKANLMEEIRTQKKVNSSQIEMNKSAAGGSNFQNPAHYQVAKAAPLRSAGQPRSSGSLSMRMLDAGLQEWEGTDSPATSVFDVKRGNNPTGANAPRGFRSVMAPVELPQELRHKPMHAEYQIHHNKQSWIEPRML